MSKFIPPKSETCFVPETIPLLLTLTEVAKFLGVCPRTVSRLVANGDLPNPAKVGRGSRWFRNDLTAYFQKLDNLRQTRGGAQS